MLTSRDGELRSLEAVPFPKLTGLDNTVNPVPKISGYVFNTLQTNSAAHVLNTNMNPINEDTHICDLNLYETIFQNWCLIDELHSMTPDMNDYGVTPPNVNTSSVAFLPPNHSGGDPKSPLFTGSSLESTPDQGLLETDLFRHIPKILFFTQLKILICLHPFLLIKVNKFKYIFTREYG